MRLVSFVASSAASWIRVSPEANAAGDREHRQLVDDRLVAGDVGAVQRGRLDRDVAHRLADSLARHLHVDLRPHPSEHVDVRDPARVQAHILQDDRRSRARSWPPRRRTRPTTGRPARRARRPAPRRARPGAWSGRPARSARRAHPACARCDHGSARAPRSRSRPRPAGRPAPAPSSPARWPPRARGARRATRRPAP